MNSTLAAILARLMSNKHTTCAAIVFAAAWALDKIAPIWLPTHVEQIHATVSEVTKAALFYATLMGADSKPINGLTPAQNGAIQQPTTDQNSSTKP